MRQEIGTKDFYRMGHELHAQKQYYAAFEHFVMANSLVPGFFDIPKADALIHQIVHLNVTPDYSGDTGEDLVFVIGMPRSGTTLIERIIHAHPQGFGNGELGAFTYILDKFLLEPEFTIAEARKMYRREQPRREGMKVVDKLPRNILAIGVIRSVFPDAKIINVARDKFQCLFSMYANNFDAPYKHRWETLNLFYNQCQVLINHFEPFTVAYEDVVTDFENTITNMLKYTGLDYNAGCANFHKDTATVATCSKDQVSQPLFTDGLSKWTPYKEFLK